MIPYIIYIYDMYLLFFDVYMYLLVFMYLCIYIYIYIYLFMYLFMSLFTYLYVHIEIMYISFTTFTRPSGSNWVPSSIVWSSKFWSAATSCETSWRRRPKARHGNLTDLALADGCWLPIPLSFHLPFGKHTKSYWKLPSIVDLPIKDVDFP